MKKQAIFVLVIATIVPLVLPAAVQDDCQDANIPATGPVGPDVPLSEVEKGLFAKHITVEGRTAAAVQIACERTVKEGIRVVFLPAGQYVFDKEVRVPGGLTLLGEGAKTLCQTEDQSVHLFHVEGDRVRFTRLRLQGADTSPSTNNNTYGITVSGKQNIRIDHCELLGFSYATTFGSEATAQIDHCFIHHNLRDGLGYGVAIYSGAYVLVSDNEFSHNVFRNLRTVTKSRSLVAISVSYGTHNNVPVEGCMPHNIEIEDNVFLIKEGIKYEKYSLGKAENITIDGKLAPKTRVERPALLIPQLQEMGEDGILRWREDRGQKGTGAHRNTGERLEKSGKSIRRLRILADLQA